MGVWFSLITAPSFIGVAGTTSDEPKFQSAIEGIVHKFHFQIHFSSPSKELVQIRTGRKSFATNFKDDRDDLF